MLIPLSWIKEFAQVPQSATPQDISDCLVRVGFEVEGVTETGKDISGPIIVGQVISIEEITEFKKPIRWVGLNSGTGNERFVICGATNFKVGDLVVLSLPGAVLPGGFAISQRETYGKISDGMIASTKELGLGDDHSGILVLPPGSAKPGDDALPLLEISDVIFDVAVNPDRGYALSIRGLAREIAASFGVQFTDPGNRVDTAVFKSGKDGIAVEIEDSTGASVIHIRTLDSFNPATSTPLWMRRKIEKCGMRSISFAVDVTNYVMLELGQPLHAFDADHINGSIHIRRANKYSAIKTLDGQVRTLNATDLLVCDDKEPLALAGTMGGEKSEVTAGTLRIAIEAARFDPVAIAKNARSHKLSTEASRRFERGVDPEMAGVASARAAQLIIEFGGAKHVGSQTAGKIEVLPAVVFNPRYPEELTGAKISNEVVAEKLAIVGCSIADTKATLWKVTPPSWRADLAAPADLVEEVARMIGFDAIPSILPLRPVSPGLTPTQVRRRVVANLLAERGFVEVQTYPFVSQSTITKMGFTGERASTFQILNPMSEDVPLLRPHLIPGLVEAAQRNLSRGFRNFALFEIGSVFRKPTHLAPAQSPEVSTRPSQKIVDAIYASVPSQPTHVGGLLVGSAEVQGWQGEGRPFDWSDAISHAQTLLTAFRVDFEVKRSDFAPWHPGRCAELLVDGIVIAHAGELHPRVVSEFGLPDRACAFVINLTAVPFAGIVKSQFLGTMPAAVQDISLIVDAQVPARDVEDALREGAGTMLETIELFDRYDQIGEGKISLAFTLTFRAPDRTLTAAEVSEMREAAAAQAIAKTGAVVRTA